MRKEFTGRHMTAILVVGFGIVFAVNFTMAALATEGFGGVVVENSYVASQKYNGWLEEAREQDKLGYNAEIARDNDGHLVVSTTDVPNFATASAEIRRPLGTPDARTVKFERSGPDEFRSSDPIPAGRWTVRLTLRNSGKVWAREAHIS
ncbi:FixH family protein [Qipengyuania soli]|uniref:FixH family protein n=2 Tax=Qipengyuania soli TaxID=2782568 RepID=A0A7S8IVV6_9SPHN|nr:FixH family protein [Qipengyuania soli]